MPGGLSLAARQSLLLSGGPSTKCRSEIRSVHAVTLQLVGGHSQPAAAVSLRRQHAIVERHAAALPSRRPSRTHQSFTSSRRSRFLRTHTPTTPSKYTDTIGLFSMAHPVSKGRPDCMSGLGPRRCVYPAIAAHAGSVGSLTNDNANAGVIWEARGLWPVPIEGSNHETQHNESPMSPCSHAQQHDRRSLANGRQTSSAVSSSSLRAALPHRCHWLSCRI